MTAMDVQQREAKIEGLLESHFSFDGVMEQIGYFMLGDYEKGDLQCQALPPSRRHQYGG